MYGRRSAKLGDMSLAKATIGFLTMRMDVVCPGATAEQLALGRRAAVRTLLAADVSILAAWLAEGRWRQWDGGGREDEDALSDEEQRALDAVRAAEDAAARAMNLFDDASRPTLCWTVV